LLFAPYIIKLINKGFVHHHWGTRIVSVLAEAAAVGTSRFRVAVDEHAVDDVFPPRLRAVRQKVALALEPAEQVGYLQDDRGVSDAVILVPSKWRQLRRRVCPLDWCGKVMAIAV